MDEVFVIKIKIKINMILILPYKVGMMFLLKRFYNKISFDAISNNCISTEITVLFGDEDIECDINYKQKIGFMLEIG